jgi:hypothetical protein
MQQEMKVQKWQTTADAVIPANSCGNRAIVEAEDDSLVDRPRHAPLALAAKAIDVRPSEELVVAAKQMQTIWEEQLQTVQKKHNLAGITSAVDVVAEAEIFGMWRITERTKDANECIDVGVDVTDDVMILREGEARCGEARKQNQRVEAQPTRKCKHEAESMREFCF